MSQQRNVKQTNEIKTCVKIQTQLLLSNKRKQGFQAIKLPHQEHAKKAHSPKRQCPDDSVYKIEIVKNVGLPFGH